MHLFLLAAAALVLAAVLWYRQASGAAAAARQPETDPASRLRQALAQDPGPADLLAAAARALETVMAHPSLGGPGFLLIQFPTEGGAVVTAQYPNIREGLYRRIIRQELDRDALAAAGVPEALLSLEPDFEAESGGMVLLSVGVEAVPPVFAESLRSRRERALALDLLAQALEVRLPRFSVRPFGADLLLSPDRESVGAGTTSTGG